MATQQLPRPTISNPATRQQGPRTSSLLPPTSMLRPPRVMVQDENRIAQYQVQPQQNKYSTQRTSSGPVPAAYASGIKANITATVKKADSIRKPVLEKNTNINNTIPPADGSTTQCVARTTYSAQQLHQPSANQGAVPRKMKPAIAPPVPTQTPAESIARTRAQSMLPAPTTSKAIPALVRNSSASAAISKRQANVLGSSFSASTTRFASTKIDSGNIRKPSTATTTSTRHGHRTSALATSTIALSEAQAMVNEHAHGAGYVSVNRNDTAKVPAAPKVSATRAQVPTTARSGAQTIQQLTTRKPFKDISAVQGNGAKSHQGPLIPAVPLFDSQLYLDDTKMEVTPTGDNGSCAVLPDMEIDITSEQEEFDPDPTLVFEYQASIFAYKREMEIKLLPDPDYMSRQIDLTWHYRVQLIEWLVQVHGRFDLLQETMHLCINYLDRFLSKVVIPLDQLQLAGTVALLLASKYEEIQSPAIEELVYLGGNAYTPARIRQAEIGMLRALNYDMGAPGPMSFLRRISRADNYDVDIRTLAKYFVDITLCDHRFIGLPSSMIAAVGYRASMMLLFRGEWTREHELYAGYTELMLTAGINVLLTMLEEPGQTHKALFTKYQDEVYMRSSEYIQSLGLAQIRAFRS